jgi:hypothetical protein
VIKEHIERHQKIYWAGSLIVIAGISFYIGRRNSITLVKNVVSGQGNTVMNIQNWIGRRGGLSYMVGCHQNDSMWMTQHGAALSVGTSDTNMSKHLKYGEPIPGVDETFFRVGIAA